MALAVRVAMENEARQDRAADHYYTPSRLRWLLSIYAYLDGPLGSGDRIGGKTKKRPVSFTSEAERAMRKADVDQALEYLRAVDYRAYLVVWKHCVMGESLRHIGVIKGYHHETIRRWDEDGIQVMSEFLGWRKGAS